MFEAKWKERTDISKAMKSNLLNITLEKYEYKGSIKSIWSSYDWDGIIFNQIEDEMEKKENDQYYWHWKH